MLSWTRLEKFPDCQEAMIGHPQDGDGVRFLIQHKPTCYRRGPWNLTIEVASGEHHIDWGCFDDADQPNRWYHSEETAKSEAEAIAQVLMKDRLERGPFRSSSKPPDPPLVVRRPE